MKRYILLVLVIFLSSYAYAACYDTDGGINYKQKGTCKDTNNTEGSDSCMTWGLVEYYCIHNGCAAQIRTCEKCQDGVCLSKEADDVQQVNKAPIVNFLIMAIPGKTEVAFKVEASDPEGQMVVYTIDFGDGNKASNKPYISHDYKTNGTFKATVTARDSDGQATTISKEFTIEPQKMVEAPKKQESKTTESQSEDKKGFFRKIIDFFKNLF
jgi:PKD repeat protein